MHRPPANRVSGPGWVRAVVVTPAKRQRDDESPEVWSCLELLIGGCARSDPRKGGVGTVGAENRALPALPSVGHFVRRPMGMSCEQGRLPSANCDRCRFLARKVTANSSSGKN